MEQHRFPRRSVSHGTLRGNYSSHSSHGGSALPSPIRPLHKPLRSVNENSVLLHSPGALESMLKTTTETGDIGIFTIKPIPPSPLRPRGTLMEDGHFRPRPRRSVDDMYRRNHSLRLPSHQEVVPESFSVYGSDSLKSGTSTLSPNSTEGPGQRSYSMTTCGSRNLSHYKSTNTLQSQASGGSQLQRPRSPFPYPTRLKRPGIRPVSPAVTENGQVDYSRMVEINRVSYRTVHGHFKHGYTPMMRKPYPLGMRIDVNRSTPSLAPPGPPPHFHAPRPPSIRTHSPASVTSWNTPCHEGLDSASTRASSLTSMSNMYRRIPPVIIAGQNLIEEPPPRYYDYTEDFENKPPRVASVTQTFMPVLPQAVRYSRPNMYREDDDYLSTTHLAAVFGEGDSAFYEGESQMINERGTTPALTAIPDRSRGHAEAEGRRSFYVSQDCVLSRNSTAELETSEVGSRSTRTSDIDLLPSQIGRDSMETFNPSLDLERRGAPQAYRYVAYRASTAPRKMTKSPEKHVHVSGGRTLTIRSEQGVILRADTYREETDPAMSDGRQSRVRSMENGSKPLEQADDLLGDDCLVSQETHELQAGSAQDERQNREIPSRVGSTTSDTTLGHPGPTNIDTVENSMMSNEAMLEEGEVEQSSEDEQLETSNVHQYRRHRRKHAALRISTTNLPRGDNEGHPHIPPTCSTVPVVSPKPISPARQLKVKNSIPQLMKALPPLPDTLGYDLPLTTTDVLEDEFAEVLVPMGFHMPEDTLQPQVQLETRSRYKEINGPKFRLKIRTKNYSETSHGDIRVLQQEKLDADTRKEVGGRNIQSRTHNKLKVRSPRRARLSSSHSSTIRHNRCAETPQIVADLVRERRQDLFSVPLKSDAVLLRKRRRPLPQLASPHAVATSDTYRELDRGAPLASCRTPSSAPTTNNNERTVINGGTIMGSMPSHGLIKRLSNLHTLLSSPSLPGRRARGADSLRIRNIASSVLTNTDMGLKASFSLTEFPATETTQLRFSQRFRAKLSKWARVAKTAMRKCANRKHNRHEQEATERV